jgi:hypothetical protein
MGQGAVLESIRYTMARYDLLPNTSYHLRNVDYGAFGPTGGHDKGCVVPAELFHTDLTDLFSDFGEDGGDHGFEGLFLVAAGFVFEFAFFGEGDEVFAVCVGFFD